MVSRKSKITFGLFHKPEFIWSWREKNEKKL